jgi:MerR family transcriptional regulator, light-induced transcriptional regulator
MSEVEVRHSIRTAARLAGLNPHVIRVWERRYGAVEPARTGTNRRFYSSLEVERLRLLRQAIATGHRIGNIARLPTEQLRQLIIELAPPLPSPVPGSQKPGEPAGAEAINEACLDAIRRMDSAALEAALTRGLIALGHQGLLQRTIAPLVQQLGDLWQDGSLTAGHEHFASAGIRHFLGNIHRPYAPSDAIPCLVVATPSGQLHELGAALITAAARNAGWHVVYLGVSLPAAEIAGAAIQNRAQAVALSIVYPVDDPQVAQELRNLRRFLPADVRILAGGRGAPHYAESLNGVGALQSHDLAGFLETLRELRERRVVAGF